MVQTFSTFCYSLQGGHKVWQHDRYFQHRWSTVCCHSVLGCAIVDTVIATVILAAGVKAARYKVIGRSRGPMSTFKHLHMALRRWVGFAAWTSCHC